ncbi:carbohydrate ABC transporter permease [Treponema sp. OMZ 840]|uniref:carbohydrate ABC transporter permease n=1 Tax=Treponema sp. OMZ 840 TaxID=244313 RepID=UPI003D8E0D65
MNGRGSRYIFIFLVLSSFLMIFPFYWTVSSSMKLESEILASPPQWWPNPIIFSNYVKLFLHIPNFGLYFFNSTAVTIVVTFCQVLLSTLAGYAFAKLKFPGRDGIFFVMLLGLMIPLQVNLIPLYKIMDLFHWLDTYWALVVPNAVSIFNVFLMRQYMQSLPDELFEAARIDGCSEFFIFLKIALPLSLAGTTTLIIFSVMNSWNSFLWPRIVTHTETLFVLPVGLSQIQMKTVINHGEILAGTTLTALPLILLFMFMQNYFIDGMTAGAVKE